MASHPQPLWDHWDDFIKKLSPQGKMLLCLDFDGTLSPIVRVPEKAQLPKKTRPLLQALKKHPRVQLCIMSGRFLKDLKSRAQLPGVIYGGSHGMEIHGPNIQYLYPDVQKHQPLIQKLKKEFWKKIQHVPGAYIEKKRFSFALHSRRIPKKYLKEYETHIEEIKKSTQRLPVRWKSGHCVWEIVPKVNWHKGEAVKWLIQKTKPTSTIAMGDDKTDEDMFKVLKTKGTSIRIAPPTETKAKFTLQKQTETATFLRRFLKHLSTP